MSDKRSIHGVWLIERQTGRNLVARAYSGIDIDMDLIAPFLSATHTFIDKATNETLKTIDTETNRYVWLANDNLLFVMAVSKAARTGHMRFLLEYALNEFMRNEIPDGSDISSVLKEWHGNPESFIHYADFIDELVSQFEETDDSLVASKSMDSLEVYNHLFRAIMQVEIDKKTRKKLVDGINERLQSLIETYPFLASVPVDEAGIEVISIDVHSVPYRTLRVALEEMLKVVTDVARKVVDAMAYRNMIFEHAMPYVKKDMDRIQIYAILDDVIRYMF